MIGGGDSKFDVYVSASGPLGGYITAPPSKNYTTRLILAASLADGDSLIRRPATNDDALALVRCCRALGAKITEQGGDLAIRGVTGRPANPGVLNPGNAGAVLRLLLGVAALAEGEIRFETDYADSLGKRPNRELLEALRQLGAEAQGAGEEGCLPITIAGGPQRLKAGPVCVDARRSSQFLSSVLFLAPHLAGRTVIELADSPPGTPRLVSAPLIDQTIDALERFGGRVEREGNTFKIDGPQHFVGGDHEVNGDWPSAAALFAAVAGAGGMSRIDGLREDAQGERRVREALTAMGCDFSGSEAEGLFIHSKGALRAIEFNGDLATDAVLALEGAAALANGTTRLAGIANLRLKETDRIAEPLAELERIGATVAHGEDWVEITGSPEGYEGGIDVNCRGDHRIAQMLAIVALRCEKGLTLRGAECVSKSYPGFFEDLLRMGVKIEKILAGDSSSR